MLICDCARGTFDDSQTTRTRTRTRTHPESAELTHKKLSHESNRRRMDNAAGNGTKAGSWGHSTYASNFLSSLMEPRVRNEDKSSPTTVCMRLIMLRSSQSLPRTVGGYDVIEKRRGVFL
jgi:hypothetical protein